jgi:hypothetical protein
MCNKIALISLFLCCFFFSFLLFGGAADFDFKLQKISSGGDATLK